MSTYCSLKFSYLTVCPEKREIASCCSADPIKVDLSLLKDNKFDIFNIKPLQQDRIGMLAGQRVSSCEKTCWQIEDAGFTSIRQSTKSDLITHTNIVASPTILNIRLDSQCNLTCSYCCKEYSTSWTHDIIKNGMYFDEPRFQLTPQDKIRQKLSQTDVKNSQSTNLLLNTSIQYSTIELVEISGGEPFLNTGLVELINRIDHPIEIFSGLGVQPSRFEKLLTKIPKHVSINISAENVGKLHEFNRYGSSYENFLKNVDTIHNSNRSYRFSSTLNNLTIHGFDKFQKEFDIEDNRLQLLTSPEYLSMNVIDKISQSAILKHNYIKFDTEIKKIASQPYNLEQKVKLKIYLIEFARRRSLSLNVFPESFLHWLEIKEKV